MGFILSLKFTAPGLFGRQTCLRVMCSKTLVAFVSHDPHVRLKLPNYDSAKMGQSQWMKLSHKPVVATYQSLTAFLTRVLLLLA